MLDVLKDIKDGSLPLEDVPGFLMWGIRKMFWVFALVIGIGFFVILLH